MAGTVAEELSRLRALLAGISLAFFGFFAASALGAEQSALIDLASLGALTILALHSLPVLVDLARDIHEWYRGGNSELEVGEA